jgi:ubiquinone/menaquinone biosynthesis C-methylase UbiE
MIRYDRPASLTALDAISEAQKLAFSPIAFQAAASLVRLGILDAVDRAGDDGASAAEIAAEVGVGTYGVGVLLDMGLSIGLVWLRGDRYVLDKVGHFLLHDKMTRINMSFVADVCYDAMSRLEQSVKDEKPRGLEQFGDWPTLYPGLTRLPEPARTSWFSFDQFYSTAAFRAALPIVFARKPRHVLDIGGNTGAWATAAAAEDRNVRITIVDLPEQIAAARDALRESAHRDRIELWAADLLDESQPLPAGTDAVWMSQFLDCFAEEQIAAILARIVEQMPRDGVLFVLELFSDVQRHAAAAYSLNATSLYFTCIANGVSRMYRFDRIAGLLSAAGLRVAERHDDLGLGHTLLVCVKEDERSKRAS